MKNMCTVLVHTVQSPEPVFGSLWGAQKSILCLAGRYDDPIGRTGPTGYIPGVLYVYKFGLWLEIMKEVAEEEKKRLHRH